MNFQPIAELVLKINLLMFKVARYLSAIYKRNYSYVGITKVISLSLIFTLIITCMGTTAFAEVSTSFKNKQSLQEKVSKGYANKFCNAIGIGVSIEGAAKLSISENINPKFNPSLWVELAKSGEKNLDSLDQTNIVHLISENVVRDCGYPIDLNGETGVKEFEDFFLSMRKEINK